MNTDTLKAPDPEFTEIPKKTLREYHRYMPYFKVILICLLVIIFLFYISTIYIDNLLLFRTVLVAIDEVHVLASIPPRDQILYIGRKGMLT